MRGWSNGEDFIFAAPEQVPAVWGRGEEVLWSQGEPLMLVGPQGVGKTTLAQQLALARVGVRTGELLGLPVRIDPKRVLYLALDRPHQAARSLRRMVDDNEADRFAVRTCLDMWSGPLPFSLGDDPERLTTFVAERDYIGTVVIDSLKDCAVGLNEDVVGGKVKAALALLIAAGVDVVVLHHQRKASSDNRRPNSLSDVYGSTWLTAGAGSVVLLWGEPGDPIVDVRHLKQPAAEVGPLTLVHDHERGVTDLHAPADLFALLASATDGGVTARDAAAHLYGTAEPGRAQVEKARRKLDRLVKKRQAMRVDGDKTRPAVWRPVALKVA